MVTQLIALAITIVWLLCLVNSSWFAVLVCSTRHQIATMTLSPISASCTRTQISPEYHGYWTQQAPEVPKLFLLYKEGSQQTGVVISRQLVIKDIVVQRKILGNNFVSVFFLQHLILYRNQTLSPKICILDLTICLPPISAKHFILLRAVMTHFEIKPSFEYRAVI